MDFITIKLENANGAPGSRVTAQALPHGTISEYLPHNHLSNGLSLPGTTRLCSAQSPVAPLHMLRERQDQGHNSLCPLCCGNRVLSGSMPPKAEGHACPGRACISIKSRAEGCFPASLSASPLQQLHNLH